MHRAGFHVADWMTYDIDGTGERWTALSSLVFLPRSLSAACMDA
jgi:hypothetical protein